MGELAMKALLFDCDGVLVDTERDGHRVAFNRAFLDAGLSLQWSVERYGELLTTGGGKERMRRDFDETAWPVAAAERHALVASLHRAKTEIFMQLIEEGKMSLRDGVARLIDEAIASGIPVAVCSTSNERAVSTIVRVLLSPRRAEHIAIFAGDVVASKKPAPDIYLLAAKTLGAEPSRCVVVEDSHIGLTAAKAAGMRCVVTRSAYTLDEDFSAADRVVDHLDQGIDIASCDALLFGPPHAAA